jgi:hypothetical protein
LGTAAIPSQGRLGDFFHHVKDALHIGRREGEHPAAEDDAVDVFAHGVPREMSMRDLRAVAAAQTSAERADAPSIEQIPFGMEIEMERMGKIGAWFRLKFVPSWNVDGHKGSWKVTHDGSLDSGGEIVSPVMRLAGGRAEDEIRRVYGIARKGGGRATDHCGLHVHVDAKCLGPTGMAALMRMAMENEGLLFGIAQNGKPQHRGEPNGYRYCKPFSNNLGDAFDLMHAESRGQFRNALYEQVPANRGALPPAHVDNYQANRYDPARYFAINFNSYWYRGTVEFRIFDGTDDPEKAIANVKLALGMVAAASRGDYAFLEKHGISSKRAVSREAFDYFMSQVAPQPALRQKLSDMFTQGGGQFVDDAPVNDANVLNTAFLMQRGYRFEADGKRLTSPFEVRALMTGGGYPRHRVRVSGPGVDGYDINDARDLRKLVRKAG